MAATQRLPVAPSFKLEDLEDYYDASADDEEDSDLFLPALSRATSESSLGQLMDSCRTVDGEEADELHGRPAKPAHPFHAATPGGKICRSGIVKDIAGARSCDLALQLDVAGGPDFSMGALPAKSQLGSVPSRPGPGGQRGHHHQVKALPPVPAPAAAAPGHLTAPARERSALDAIRVLVAQQGLGRPLATAQLGGQPHAGTINDASASGRAVDISGRDQLDSGASQAAMAVGAGGAVAAIAAATAGATASREGELEEGRPGSASTYPSSGMFGSLASWLGFPARASETSRASSRHTSEAGAEVALVAELVAGMTARVVAAHSGAELAARELRMPAIPEHGQQQGAASGDLEGEAASVSSIAVAAARTSSMPATPPTTPMCLSTAASLKSTLPEASLPTSSIGSAELHEAPTGSASGLACRGSAQLLAEGQLLGRAASMGAVSSMFPSTPTNTPAGMTPGGSGPTTPQLALGSKGLTSEQLAALMRNLAVEEAQQEQQGEGGLRGPGGLQEAATLPCECSPSGLEGSGAPANPGALAAAAAAGGATATVAAILAVGTAAGASPGSSSASPGAGHPKPALSTNPLCRTSTSSSMHRRILHAVPEDAPVALDGDKVAAGGAAATAHGEGEEGVLGGAAVGRWLEEQRVSGLLLHHHQLGVPAAGQGLLDEGACSDDEGSLCSSVTSQAALHSAMVDGVPLDEVALRAPGGERGANNRSPHSRHLLASSSTGAARSWQLRDSSESLLDDVSISASGLANGGPSAGSSPRFALPSSQSHPEHLRGGGVTAGPARQAGPAWQQHQGVTACQPGHQQLNAASGNKQQQPGMLGAEGLGAAGAIEPQGARELPVVRSPFQDQAGRRGSQVGSVCLVGQSGLGLQELGASESVPPPHLPPSSSMNLTYHPNASVPELEGSGHKASGGVSAEVLAVDPTLPPEDEARPQAPPLPEQHSGTARVSRTTSFLRRFTSKRAAGDVGTRGGRCMPWCLGAQGGAAGY